MQPTTVKSAGYAPAAVTSAAGYTIKTQERSAWHCQVFGTTDLVFIPRKGAEPNWLHRKLQQLAFGVRWVRVTPK